jgi:uncharacterized protein involved in oxidation of intracellular sulfur
MNTLFILNDPPYGTERGYNGLRLAAAVARRPDQEVRVFLMGDAAGFAKKGHKLPDGYYNVNRMLESVHTRRGEIGVCGTCMDARGIDDAELVDGARRSTLDELTEWTVAADKVIAF